MSAARRKCTPMQDTALAKVRQRRAPGGHVYIVEFHSGVIKVGQSKSPESRIASHQDRAQIHGDGISRRWISARHDDFLARELRLIDFCKNSGYPVSGREYFRDVDADALLAYAVSLGRAAVAS